MAVTSTGDPRPPVVPVYHVKLGSIPDASGSSHVQISWTPQPNAAGYFIYEATEASLLDALVPFFEQGTFQVPQIDRVLALSDGVAAYQEVASGQVRGRLVLAP